MTDQTQPTAAAQPANGMRQVTDLSLDELRGVVVQQQMTLEAVKRQPNGELILRCAELEVALQVTQQTAAAQISALQAENAKGKTAKKPAGAGKPS